MLPVIIICPVLALKQLTSVFVAEAVGNGFTVPLAVTAVLQHAPLVARTQTLYVPAATAVVYVAAEFVISVPVAELTQ